MIKKEFKKGKKYHDEIRLNRLTDKHRRHIRRELNSHGVEVTKELKNVVSTGSRSGRVYFYRGTPYRASAPGEPPAKRSGRLAEGFRHKARRMELVIGNTAFSKKGFPYPLALVEGTIKMKPRPYFLVTIKRLHSRLRNNLGRCR